jgi:hypothetical protein
MGVTCVRSLHVVYEITVYMSGRVRLSVHHVFQLDKGWMNLIKFRMDIMPLDFITNSQFLIS